MFGNDPFRDFDGMSFHAHHGTKKQRLDEVIKDFGAYGPEDWRGHLVAAVHDLEHKARKLAPVAAIMSTMMTDEDAAKTVKLAEAALDLPKKLREAFPDIDFTVKG